MTSGSSPDGSSGAVAASGSSDVGPNPAASSGSGAPSTSGVGSPGSGSAQSVGPRDAAADALSETTTPTDAMPVATGGSCAATACTTCGPGGTSTT